MVIKTEAIVSDSDMLKNYNTCRQKAENYGKLYIMLNDKVDAVLFSIAEYDKYSWLIEYAEQFGVNEVLRYIESHKQSAGTDL